MTVEFALFGFPVARLTVGEPEVIEVDTEDVPEVKLGFQREEPEP